MLPSLLSCEHGCQISRLLAEVQLPTVPYLHNLTHIAATLFINDPGQQPETMITLSHFSAPRNISSTLMRTYTESPDIYMKCFQPCNVFLILLNIASISKFSTFLSVYPVEVRTMAACLLSLHCSTLQTPCDLPASRILIISRNKGPQFCSPPDLTLRSSLLL